MKASLRIALLVPGGVDRSGRERVIPHLLWLIEDLSRQHHVSVISLYQYPHPCVYPLLGATVYDLGNIKEDKSEHEAVSVAVNNKYQRSLEIIQSHGPWDVFHGFWGLEAGWLAATIGQTLKVPSVISLMGAELVSLPDIDYGAQLKAHRRRMVDETLERASCLTVASRFMGDIAKAYGLQTEMIPFGVHDACFQSNQAQPGPPWRLLQVASLNRVKDQTTLLYALRKIVDQESQVHLDIIGEDTLNGKLQGLVATLGLSQHVTFHGFLPNDLVRPYFQQAHIYLVSSLNETGPIAMLEAAACGVPTVGTCVGYVSDWADKQAIAVAIGDSDALAEGVLTLLCDALKRNTLGSAAQQWVRQYDAKWTTRTLLELYSSLIGKMGEALR